MRTRAYFPVPRNGVKTETFPPRNDRTTELNVNFLLAATVPYSRKYWQQELNLAVEPKIAIARILSRIKFGGSVQDHYMYTCIYKYEILADFNLEVVT